MFDDIDTDDLTRWIMSNPFELDDHERTRVHAAMVKAEGEEVKAIERERRIAKLYVQAKKGGHSA